MRPKAGLCVALCPAPLAREKDKVNAKFYRNADFTIYEGPLGEPAKFTTPTPVQDASIPVALEGKDVLATAQTGTGKTLAFFFPVIEKLLANNVPGIAALVLVPTRELAMQVVEVYNVLRGKQLSPAALVVGGLAEQHQLHAISRGARLVVQLLDGWKIS